MKGRARMNNKIWNFPQKSVKKTITLLSEKLERGTGGLQLTGLVPTLWAGSQHQAQPAASWPWQTSCWWGCAARRTTEWIWVWKETWKIINPHQFADLLWMRPHEWLSAQHRGAQQGDSDTWKESSLTHYYCHSHRVWSYSLATWVCGDIWGKEQRTYSAKPTKFLQWKQQHKCSSFIQL